MTGEKVIDVADASGTLMLDVARRRWSEEILDATGVSPDLLPKLYESQEISGQVGRRAAEETGLPEGTPVVAGAGDNAAGAIGMGLAKVGAVGVTIGTSGVVFAVTDSPFIDLRGRIHTLCHAIPDRWHVTGVTQAAGLSLKWFRENFAPNESYDDLTALAGSVPAGSDGLFWTPYLMGERTPHIDAGARASLVGLTARHTKGHVVRAILEGVAFSLRDSLSIFEELGIPIRSIRLGGGGARSPLWRQIQADVYGRTVEVPTIEEGAAFGAALLAGVGAGAWDSVGEACAASISSGTATDPDPADAARLGDRYGEYRKIYPSTREIR
jgi:xylulokinase